MKHKLKEFIQANMELIDDNNFDRLYKNAFIELVSNQIPQLTQILLDAGIDPLQHVTKVPFMYASGLELTSVEIPDGVQGIDARAFENCKSLTKVVVPDSAKDINYAVFQGCTSLVDVKLPVRIKGGTSPTLFEGCTSLKSIKLPECAFIGSDLFSNCINLESIYIPKTVTTILPNAFDNCTSLTTIHYEGTVLEWLSINKRDLSSYVPSIERISCKDKDIVF